MNHLPDDLDIEHPDALLAYLRQAGHIAPDETPFVHSLAVGWSSDHIKIGSITQSDRLAKYNRLLAIERETGLPLARWPGTAR